MSKALISSLVLFLPLLSFGDPFTPSSTGYYNQSQFAAAVAQAAPGTCVFMDNFIGGGPGLEGVSVSSDIAFDGYAKGAGNGRFAPGAYLDATQKYSVTVWSFSQPVYAFGGTWDLDVVNAGLEVNAGGATYFMPDIEIAPLSSYRNNKPDWPLSQWSGFWGFVSRIPVQQVEIFSGDEGTSNSFEQNYTFTGMQIATAVPEPSNLNVFGLAAALIGLAILRRGRVLARAEAPPIICIASPASDHLAASRLP